MPTFYLSLGTVEIVQVSTICCRLDDNKSPILFILQLASKTHTFLGQNNAMQLDQWNESRQFMASSTISLCSRVFRPTFLALSNNAKPFAICFPIFDLFQTFLVLMKRLIETFLLSDFCRVFSPFPFLNSFQ